MINPYSERLHMVARKSSWPALDAFFKTLDPADVGRVDNLFGGKPSVNLSTATGTEVIALGGSSAIDSTQQSQNAFAFNAAASNGFTVSRWPAAAGSPDLAYADVANPTGAAAPTWGAFLQWASLRIAAAPESAQSEVEWFEGKLGGKSKRQIANFAMRKWGLDVSTQQSKAAMIAEIVSSVFGMGVVLRILRPMSKTQIVTWALDNHGLVVSRQGSKRRVIFRVLRELYDSDLELP